MLKNSKKQLNSLYDIGFDLSEQSVAMFMNLTTPTLLPSKENLNVRSMNHDLKGWITPLISAFESTFELTHPYAKAHERALKNKICLHHLILYQNNVPISSLTLSIHGTMARIDDVGTMSELQKKGYTTYLINHALEEAKTLGAIYCFLDASIFRYINLPKTRF